MRSFLASILLCFFAVLPASGQHQSSEKQLFDVDLRNVELDEALAEFSTITGTGITYDPRLTKGVNVYCVLHDADINDVLFCLLDSTQLTFARLASGTFVVMQQGQVPPQEGYLTGLVTDQTTGTPLTDAHILLASNTLDLGAISNNQGLFTLPSLLPGRYIIQTSYLGYESEVDTLEILPGQRTFRRITLSAQPVTVTPIIIDGLHLQKPSEQLERTILLRPSTAEDFYSTQFTSQFHAISGIRMNDITADAHLQGSNSGEHQFRIDGIPVFLPQQAIGFIGPFSPFAIQSLTIHKSGFGVEEGSHLAGVIEARQFLESQSFIDTQVDLNAINNRLAWQKEWNGQKSLSIMGATRFSLWDLIPQSQLQDMLNSWARPDPFLIFSPSQNFSSIDPARLQDALNISSVPTTNLSFTDVHLTSQYKSNSFSGFNTSLYYGSNQFSGTLIPPAIFNADNLDLSNPNPADGGNFEESSFQPLLSVIDDYKWHNLAGQIQYHSVLGRKTLLNTQLKISSYSLDQTYLQVDSLEQILGELPETDLAVVVVEDLRFPTSEIRDRNTTSEYSFDSQLDVAYGRHSLLMGIESTYTKSNLDALLASLPSLQSEAEDPATQPEQPTVTDQERVSYQTYSFRQSFFIQDRYSISSRSALELGARFTYLPNRKTVYAEPRLSIRFDLPIGQQSALSLQTAVGLYRQYLLQLDVSTLNAGALFPSKRMWIPVNEDIRPPLAYHVSQSALYSISDNLTVQAEGYIKYQQRLWLLSYLSNTSTLDRTGVRTLSEIDDLNDILSGGKGITSGISFSTAWTPGPLSLSVVYDYTSVRRRAQDLFFNAWVSAPWEEPHRLSSQLEVNLNSKFWLSANFTGIWGRSWGFRQAYYNFFGHSDFLDVASEFDFSNPNEHKLPAFYQIDLGAAYNLSLKNTNLQFRLDLLNAFDIKNVADWRLIWKDGRLEKENRYYYPAIPSIALRFSW